MSLRLPREKSKDIGEDRQILQRLGKWKREAGSLPQFVELYRQLLSLQTSVKSGMVGPEPNLSEEIVLSKFSQGLPLLKFEDLSLDWSLVGSQFCAVIDTIARHLSIGVEDAQRLRNLASNASLLRRAVRDWYLGLPLSSFAAEQHVNEDFLNAAIQATLRPFLMAHSEALRKSVKQELWRRGSCPICGGKPDFTFLDKESGGRWLLCSRCDAQWLFQRLECPYCGTCDKDTLSYITDDNEVYRLYTCDNCHSFIKAIDLRKADAGILLSLERVLTADMDKQAEEAGYRPG